MNKYLNDQNLKLRYRSKFELKGKVALVTGGAGILGRHFCEGLAEFGAAVAIVDLNGKEAAKLALSLNEKYGIQSIGIQCDVSDPKSVYEMVGKVVKEYGEINILHNNAAYKSDDLKAFYSPFEEYTLDQWRKIMMVNIDGMFLVAQAVGRQMVAQNKKASIIQTSSIYGLVAPDHRIYKDSDYLGRVISTPAVYSVSKSAVIGLTKYLATYWAESGIRVNTLIPGGVESGQNKKFQENYSSRVPMGRMANASEMVGALLYLASDASSYVTGESIIYFDVNF